MLFTGWGELSGMGGRGPGFPRWGEFPAAGAGWGLRAAVTVLACDRSALRAGGWETPLQPCGARQPRLSRCLELCWAEQRVAGMFLSF